MTHKIIISMKVEPDSQKGFENKQFCSEDIDYQPMVAWLEKNILSGDKVSIYFPDTYIDVNFGSSSQHPDAVLNNFQEYMLAFMNNSKKPSKKRVVKVIDDLSFVTKENLISKAPQWITFMVKGSTKLTTGVWSYLFVDMCPLTKGDDSNRRHWPVHSLKISQTSFKEVTESCFGLKFKDFLSTVVVVLESDQVGGDGKYAL